MRIATIVLLTLAVASLGALIGSSVAASNDGDLPPSRLVTLHHLDPLWQSISLRTGEPGHAFSDHKVGNHQSDLDFGHYHEGEFSVGIEGGRLGVILDLGPAREVATRYGIVETVGGGQTYASIRFEDDKIVIAGKGQETPTRPVVEAEMLFLRPSKGAHAKIEKGHIYLIRLTDRREAEFDRIAKLLVVGHDPETGTATIRWDLLRDIGGR